MSNIRFCPCIHCEFAKVEAVAAEWPPEVALKLYRVMLRPSTVAQTTIGEDTDDFFNFEWVVRTDVKLLMQRLGQRFACV